VRPLLRETRAGGPGGLDAAVLASEPPALGRLLIRRLLREAGLGGEALARPPVERVLALARGERGGPLDVPGGAVRVEGGRVTASAGRDDRVPAGAA
jgi:hypothetical protein